MPSSGPNFPTVATGNTNAIGGGTHAWTTPTNVEAADGVFTVNTTASNTTTDDLIGTAFGFSIPGNATILGILLEVNYKSSLASTCSENTVNLLKAGSSAGSNKSTSASIPTTATTVSYGGSSDLWGTTWTPSDINNTNFGAAASYLDNTQSMSVDFFRITVTFSVAASTMFLMF